MAYHLPSAFGKRQEAGRTFAQRGTDAEPFLERWIHKRVDGDIQRDSALILRVTPARDVFRRPAESRWRTRNRTRRSLRSRHAEAPRGCRAVENTHTEAALRCTSGRTAGERRVGRDLGGLIPFAPPQRREVRYSCERANKHHLDRGTIHGLPVPRVDLLTSTHELVAGFIGERAEALHVRGSSKPMHTMRCKVWDQFG